MATTISKNPFAPEDLRPFLRRCGYRQASLVNRYHFGTDDGERTVALAAFAHQPTDVRSACVAVIDVHGDPMKAVASYRQLGAPVVFVCREEQLQWWQQGAESPQHLATIARSELANFFQEHRHDLAPESVYRAKTRGRFASTDQLSFVDVGLMPLVEGEIGKALSGLVERMVVDVSDYLKPPRTTVKFGQWLFRSVFWLLAAKILQDKDVQAFRSLDLVNIDEVFSLIAAHYGSSLSIQGLMHEERQALIAASHTLARFSHLGHVTTESLAYVYENTLISKATRSKLGVHSTPSYLVDYMVWQLAPWIEEIPAADRHIFEPACGHAAFLVSAMRLLKDLSSTASKPSRKYLRQRLHGMEIDAFAIEIARLAMTLADIPNPDDWDLTCADMFAGRTLEQLASRSTVLLANPPFENFKKPHREEYTRQGFAPTYVNKAAEMLHRTLPHLRPGAVFGVVMPQGFLHNKNAADLRAFMAKNFEIAEICLFPDKVFTFSEAESALVLGKRIDEVRIRVSQVRYRRVREPDIERFVESYGVTTERSVPQIRFVESPTSNLRVPDLDDLWEWCKGLPRFDLLAKVGKGLEYKSVDTLSADAQTISPDYFPGAVRGFERLPRELRIDRQPPEVWMSIDPAVISRPRTGTTIGVQQLVVNYGSVSRSPWRLKAVIDRQGHAVTSRFLTVRPVSPGQPLLFFWALCNSPLANAYVYAHSGKRDVLTGVLRAMPVPRCSHDDIRRIVELTRAYLDAVSVSSDNFLSSTVDDDEACQLLKRVDAEILRLYNMPPRLERQLLDLFIGYQRPGVPFRFIRYFPDGFTPCFPLHMYLSESYRHSTAGALRARYEPMTDPAMLAALEHAVEDFGE